MPKAPGMERSIRSARSFRVQKVALAVVAAPLMLSACISEQTSTKSLAQMSPKAGEPGTDAYGYTPVKLMAFSDGTRAAMPSEKPDIAKLEADPAAPAPSLHVKVDGKTETAAKSDPLLALRADVAERKANLVQIAELTPAVSAAAPVDRMSPGKAVRISASSQKVEDRTVADQKTGDQKAGEQTAGGRGPIGATIAAVSDTAEAVGAKAVAVGQGAKAVAVAAIDTTSRAASAVSERLGDTFKGRDTITGDARMDRMIEKAAADNNIPSELAYAVVRVESHYNPLAKGSGVYGLSQIQPSTARSLGFAGPTSALFDPETNLRYGMKYLAGAWQQGGHDICQTAMKYKGGHRTTLMSRSAAAYCANVKRHMAAIERRRAPANPETIFAADQRERTIRAASRTASLTGSPSVLSERFGAPGVASVPSRNTEARAAVIAAMAPVASAAGSDAGRKIAAETRANALVASDASANKRGVVTPLDVSYLVPDDETVSRGGRVR